MIHFKFLPVFHAFWDPAVPHFLSWMTSHLSLQVGAALGPSFLEGSNDACILICQSFQGNVCFRKRSWKVQWMRIYFGTQDSVNEGTHKKEIEWKGTCRGWGPSLGLLKAVGVQVITLFQGCLQLCTPALHTGQLWDCSHQRSQVQRGKQSRLSPYLLKFMHFIRVLLPVLDVGDHGKILQNSGTQGEKKMHIGLWKFYDTYLVMCFNF